MTHPVNRSQTISTGLVLFVFLVGIWLGWAGYQRGLPYIDTVDEMAGWTMGRALLDPL